MTETRKLKIGDRVKLVGEGWAYSIDLDKIVTVDRIKNGTPWSDNVGAVGYSNGEPLEGQRRVELVEEPEPEPEQQFKPGDKVHVEYDTVVHRAHGSRTEVSGRVAVTHPIVDGGFTTALVPLDAVTRIDESEPKTESTVTTERRGQTEEPVKLRLIRAYADGFRDGLERGASGRWDRS